MLDYNIKGASVGDPYPYSQNPYAPRVVHALQPEPTVLVIEESRLPIWHAALKTAAISKIPDTYEALLTVKDWRQRYKAGADFLVKHLGENVKVGFRTVGGQRYAVLTAPNGWKRETTRRLRQLMKPKSRGGASPCNET